MLPPDTELEEDLCTPCWSMRTNGIKIESKEDIKKRIGRSPDCADAVTLSWFEGGTVELSGSNPFYDDD